MTDIVENPETQESVATPPVRDPSLDDRHRNARTKKGLVAGLAFATVLGGGIVLSQGGDNPDQDLVPAVGEPYPPEGSINPPPVPSTEMPTTTLEVVEPAEQGTLLTADTAEGIMEQLKQNFECMHNHRDVESQQNCLTAFAGEGDSPIRDKFQEYINETNTYWALNPESTYRYFHENEVIDYEITAGRAVILADIEEPSGAATKRYAFIREQVIIEDGVSATPVMTPIWRMVVYDNVSVGEVVRP